MYFYPNYKTEIVINEVEKYPIAENYREAFIIKMLPLILRANDEITEERSIVLDFHKGNYLHQEKIVELMTKYRANDIYDLIYKVDYIPISMALSQAIVESGWGGSRIFKEANAVFGQHSYSGIGIRSVDGSGRMFASFDSLLDSTRGYMRNLNSHPAYANFRKLRAKMRNSNKLEVTKLVNTLTKYSSRKNQYTNQVNQIIKTNNLTRYDADFYLMDTKNYCIM